MTLRAGGDTPDFWRLVDRAAAFESSGSIRELGYAAHLSLGLYDTANADGMSAAIGAIADEQPLKLRFARIGWFDIGPLVFWLAPEPDDRLIAVHRRLHDRIGADRSAAYYRPGEWIPHCTLAAKINPAKRTEALAFAQAPIDPIDMTFDHVDLVEFPPVSILSSVTLRPAR